jgi:hypothetical protein
MCLSKMIIYKQINIEFRNMNTIYKDDSIVLIGLNDNLVEYFGI